MLQMIRDRVTGVVAIFILGLLAVPFLFFGVEGYITSVPQDAVAKVGDSEITINEFQAEFGRYRAQLRQQQGDAYNELEVNRPEARREFLDGMIDQRLLIEHATKMGMAISPNTIAEMIRNVPAFQLNGRFDPELYRQTLTASGQSPARFERELARDLLVQQLPRAVTASSVVTEADVDRWLTTQMQQRSVAWVTIPAADFRDEIEITEQQVESFYQDNQSQFMRPERISVEYIELDTRELAETMEVDEQELLQRYEATLERFMTPERRRAAHVLITPDTAGGDDQARELAESLVARIADGEDFAALAEEFSDDPVSAAEGGDLGWIEPGVMMAEFESALYELTPGEVSEPVRTEFGWHLIKLIDVEAPRGQSFEEAREEIAAEVREERADELYIELTDRLIDMIYADPTGLEAIARDLGLELQQAGPFSRFSAGGVIGRPVVLEEAFSDLVLVERQTSEPIEIERNHAVVLRVTEHHRAEPRSLEDVSDEIRQRISREASREAARERGEQLLALVRELGEGLAAVAESQELELSEQEITRRNFELGSQVLNEIFRLPEPADGEPVLDLIGRGNDWLLVELRSVTPGDPALADEAQRQSARQQITFSRTSREFEGLLEWLRANTDIRVVADRL